MLYGKMGVPPVIVRLLTSPELPADIRIWYETVAVAPSPRTAEQFTVIDVFAGFAEPDTGLYEPKASVALETVQVAAKAGAQQNIAADSGIANDSRIVIAPLADSFQPLPAFP
jgi:hypothetical protein